METRPKVLLQNGNELCEMAVRVVRGRAVLGREAFVGGVSLESGPLAITPDQVSFEIPPIYRMRIYNDR